MRSRFLTRIARSLLPALLLLLSARPTPAAPVIAEGWDWSLPAAVRPVPYSGFVTWGPKRFDEAVTVQGAHVLWKDLNPSRGFYDWQPLLDRIEANRAAGMRTGLHLMGVERKGIPEWVLRDFNPPVLDVIPLQEDQPWRLQIVPPWHPDVEREFLAFLDAFGKTGIARRDDVVYGYIHGISASRGEELFLRKADAEFYEAEAGLTPELFGAWLNRRLDGMLKAFAGVEYKLAWMSGGPVGPTDAYREATAGLWREALAKGCGIRGGGIDFQHGLFSEPAWGSRIAASGHCLIDETNPTVAETRFRGDENEEYGAYWEWRFGPAEDYPYRHRISSLHALQMRQNFQMVSPATLALNPELNRYVLLTQGRTRTNSPDAWAYLRECALYRGPVRNLERWCIQRDLPRSRTVNAERVDRFPLPMDPKDRNYDFDARATDLANGQDGILFRLDREFLPTPAPVLVKVTYTDREPGDWWLRYANAAGEIRRTESVRNLGDGKRRTATFSIDSLAASGQFPNDEGFRRFLREAAGGDAEANRVANPGFANEARGWTLPDEGLYTPGPDPEGGPEGILAFSYRRLDDTVHADQLVTLRAGMRYRLTGEVRNDGTGLLPGIRIGRMDWSTLLYLEAGKTGAWETLSGEFTAEVDGPVRLQLFGQGRGRRDPGMAGTSAFRNIGLHPVPAEEFVRGREMDFRLETGGPGNAVITLVRVIKADFRDPE